MNNKSRKPPLPIPKIVTLAAPPPGFRDPHIQSAVSHLEKAHRPLRDIIRRVGQFEPALVASPFHALVGSIIHQQVSMAAARSMQRKLKAACPGGRITPAALLSLTEEQYRAAGISRQKRGYLIDIGKRFADGELKPRQLKALDDEAVIAAVTQIKGVGRWTAEMLLMFSLQRWDVWPIGDLGLRKAIERVHANGKTLDKDKLMAVGEPLRPYRSVATWYLWRSLENPIKPSISG